MFRGRDRLVLSPAYSLSVAKAWIGSYLGKLESSLVSTQSTDHIVQWKEPGMCTEICGLTPFCVTSATLFAFSASVPQPSKLEEFELHSDLVLVRIHGLH